MTTLNVLHEKWSKDPEYRNACDALEEEFALASAIVAARAKAGLTQQEVAQRMKTTQSTIARLEAGRTTPSTRTLEKFAEAVGARLKISFEPIQSPWRKSTKAAQRQREIDAKGLTPACS